MAKTTPRSIRLDPDDWEDFQAAVGDLDLTPGQVVRQLIREWLEKQRKAGK